MASYTIEVWRDGGPGTGTLVMRSVTADGILADFTRDTPVAGDHSYSVYAHVNVDDPGGNVGFTRLALLLAHR